MRKNCTKVVDAFLEGRAYSEKSISTDGTTIFSYAMPIARRVAGEVHVLGGRGPTVTTSQHLGQVRALLHGRAVVVPALDNA